MWRIEHDALDVGTTRLQITSEGRVLQRGEVARLWRDDAEFRGCFAEHLRDQPHAAFRWETPPWCLASLERSFECVVVDAPRLAPRAEPEAFAEHFEHTSDPIAVFANLSGDATMLVPRPLAGHGPYNHLAAFLRNAPTEQQDALWQRVGALLLERVGEPPVWLSTAGAGVSWLHVRFDRRPKYYAFRPYARRDA